MVADFRNGTRVAVSTDRLNRTSIRGLLTQGDLLRRDGLSNHIRVGFAIFPQKKFGSVMPTLIAVDAR